MGRKTLQELTIKDNFLFAAAMLEPENCKGVIECALGIEIEHVEVSRERSIVYNPEYKGVRLDVYARDENKTHYDVEMQIVKREIFKRARYYHGQMDMELLGIGIGYEELPDSYVIFICDFDPAGLGKYRYTKKEVFAEEESYDYEDGSHTIFLSTKGTNDTEVPERLVKFLKFVGANVQESMADYKDELVSRLQASIRKIKADREMGNRYMHFGEIIRDEYKAGVEEGKLEGKLEGKVEAIYALLSDFGVIPELLKNKLMAITDMDMLSVILKKAAQAESIEAFEDEVERLLVSQKS